MRNAVIGLVAGVVIAGVIAFLLRPSPRADDEAPIIVKNGTMKIDSGNGEFVVDGSDYSHETQGNHQNGLWLAVLLNKTVADCSTNTAANANMVTIEYTPTSGPKFFVKFQPRANAGVYRTKVLVTSLADLKTPTRYRLLYPEGGYISEIKTNGTFSCKLTAADELDQVNICSSNSYYCQ